MGRTFENRKAAMARTGAMKTNLYAKYGKEIYVYAKNNGTDLDSSPGLRRLVDKAKKHNVPSHVIDKAIEKARGGGGEDFVTVRFEGFGPNNTLVIIDCLTDNNNRTFGDVRTCFNKAKAKLGGQGAVAHMFDHRAVFSFQHDNEEAVLEALINEDVDVADIENDDGIITVLTPPNEFFKAKTALTNAFDDIHFEVEEITFIPQAYTEVSGDDATMLQKLIDLLEDCDDVQEVFHNAEFR